MPIQPCISTQAYIGRSDDPLFVPAQKFQVGDTLTFLDTGEKFIWDGQDWAEDLTLIYAFKQAQL